METTWRGFEGTMNYADIQFRSTLGSLGLGLCLTLVMGCSSTVRDSAEPSAKAAPPATAEAVNRAQRAESEPPNRSPLQEPSPTGVQPGATNRPQASPTGKHIASPTAEQIKRWTPAPFEPLQLLAIRELDKTSVTARLAPTPDGRHYLVAGSRVLLWSIDKEAPEHVFLDLAPSDQERNLLSLAVSPDGRWFAVGDSTGTVRIWSLENRSEIVSQQLAPSGIQWLAISPDSQEIAAISYDNKVTTWSPESLEPRNSFSVDANGLERIEYVAPGKLAAAGETTSLWDTAAGNLVQELSPGRYRFALARSPDGARFIFGDQDAFVLWNVAESRPEARFTHGVSGSEWLAFSPDGQFLATSNGFSVLLWNLAERRIVQVLDGFGWPIAGLAWLPKTNLLAIASDIGCTRLWGTPNQGAPLGLSPLQAPLAMPATDSKTPANPDQMKQVMDMRTLPRLPGSEPNLAGSGEFGAVAPATAEEAMTFYRHFLENEGWDLVETPSPDPTAVAFRKNGFRISLHCYDAGEGKINILLSNRGDYDLRNAPKFDGAKIEAMYEDEDVVTYRTKAELLQIETTLLRKLSAAGWAAYSRLKSSYRELPDQRDMDFLKNGITLRVSVGRFPADPTNYVVQYSLSPNPTWAPIPPDSGFVEFDGSTAPALVATTSLTFDQARDFYDKELTSQGWLIRKLGRSFKDEHGWLSCVRDQSDLTVGLTRLPSGRTLIRIGDVDGSLWEQSQTKAGADDAADVAGLEAADFPRVSASQPALYDAIGKSIEIQVAKATLAEAAARFSEALAKDGWTLAEGGIRAEDYALLTFNKAAQEIELRARLKDGNAVLNFQGDGLLWNKPLPSGKQVVAYETWLRLNKLPPGLEWLDRYEAEMRALGATPPAK